MAPRPKALPRDVADALGLASHESAFREGSATIVLPSTDLAFLNPVQQFNRDLSVAVLRAWSEARDEERRQKYHDILDRRAKKQQQQQQGGSARAAAGAGEAAVPAEEPSTSTKPATTDGTAAAKASVERAKINPDQEEEEEQRPAKRARVEAAPPAIDPAAADVDAEVEGRRRAAHQDANTEYRPFRFTILEALSATGLRSIRYAREVPMLKYVLANDLSATAVQAMHRNVALNFPADRDLIEWSPGEDPKVLACQKPAEDAAGGTQTTCPQSMDTSNVDPSAPTAPDGGADNRPAQESKKAAASATAAAERASIHPRCKVRVNEGDAMSVLYAHRDPGKRFDVVDLDPYGTATPFLDGAVQAVSDGGLLCVTCTDLSILAGNNFPEKCFSGYGGTSTRAEYSHEVALRLVLHAIATSASRYGRVVTPLLSLSIDFYVRLFVRVTSGAAETKRAAGQTGVVYVCDDCQAHHEQRFGRAREDPPRRTGAPPRVKYQSARATLPGDVCDECGGNFSLSGPMWLGPLHDADFCARLLAHVEREGARYQTEARMRGMVGTAAEELETLFYFTPSRISGTFHCVNPPLATVVHALLNAGFGVSRSHCVAGSLKTSASRTQLHDLFRCWIEEHPVNMATLERKQMRQQQHQQQHHQQQQAVAANEGAQSGGADGAGGGGGDEKPMPPPHGGTQSATAVAKRLGSRPIRTRFELGREHPATRRVLGLDRKVTRYQMNPEADWGPGTAAKTARRRPTGVAATTNGAGTGTGTGQGTGTGTGANGGDDTAAAAAAADPESGQVAGKAA